METHTLNYYSSLGYLYLALQSELKAENVVRELRPCNGPVSVWVSALLCVSRVSPGKSQAPFPHLADKNSYRSPHKIAVRVKWGDAFKQDF